jgi:hypothetical protein
MEKVHARQRIKVSRRISVRYLRLHFCLNEWTAILIAQVNPVPVPEGLRVRLESRV